MNEKCNILKIASNLFFQNGVATTTITEIIFKAKIDKETFQKYYKTKDEILYEYVKTYFDKMFLHIEETIEEETSYHNKIFLFCELLLHSITSNKKFSFMLIEFTQLLNHKKNEDAYKLKTYYYEHCLHVISKLIKKGVYVREFKECQEDMIAFSILSKIIGDLILLSNNESIKFTDSTLVSVKEILNTLKPA